MIQKNWFYTVHIAVFILLGMVLFVFNLIIYLALLFLFIVWLFSSRGVVVWSFENINRLASGWGVALFAFDGFHSVHKFFVRHVAPVAWVAAVFLIVGYGGRVTQSGGFQHQNVGQGLADVHEALHHVPKAPILDDLLVGPHRAADRHSHRIILIAVNQG